MLATFGVVLGAAYMLWLIKRVIFGNINNNEIKNLKDINNLETLMLVALGLLVILLGFYPAPLLDTINISVNNLISNYEIAIQKSGIN
jgi:NADH-quinone oxidoreductase subunit M